MLKKNQFPVDTNKLQLLSVTSSMWNGVRKDILEIEYESFPPSLADSESDLRKMADSPTGIFLIVSLSPSPKILGYIAADLVEKFPDIPGVASDPHFKKGNTIYIESVAVHPEWRGRGLAIALMGGCLQQASQRGIKRVTAHVEGGSAGRIGFGMRVLKSFGNWYGTGRTFDYVEIPL